jgi:hypothetical protein
LDTCNGADDGRRPKGILSTQTQQVKETSNTRDSSAYGQERRILRENNTGQFSNPLSQSRGRQMLFRRRACSTVTGMEITIPMAVMPDYFEKLEAHILQEFADGVAAWGESVTALARWEDEHLLETPSAEVLGAHRRTVDKLIGFGRFLALTTEHPDFPDAALKENVAATLQTLRDKIPLWHGQTPKDKADAILKAAFPE